MTLFDYAQDTAGRRTQQRAVFERMREGQWWTFEELRRALYMDGMGISESGLSARIRDLRKPPYNLTVERRRTNRKGIYEYAVRP